MVWVTAGSPFGGGRDFDHDVRPTDGFIKAPGFRDGAGGVACQQRIDLQADIPVPALRGVIDRLQHVGCQLDVLDRQGFVYLRYAFALRGQGLYFGVVVRRPGDRFFENGGVGGHAPDPLSDQSGQLPGGD
jgi:hypothetical protein